METTPSPQRIVDLSTRRVQSSDEVPSQISVELSAKPSVLKRRTQSEHSKDRSNQVRSDHHPAVRFQRKDADEVIPSESIHVSAIDQPVRIFNYSLEGPANASTIFEITPMTIMTAMKQRTLLSANNIALASKLKKSWRNITFQEYQDQVVTIAKAFIKLGLDRCHGVGILGENSPEWFIANLAAIFAGGISVALNVQYTSDACQRSAFESKCNIILVSSELQCSMIHELKDQLPHLKTIVQLPTKDGTRFRDDVQTWQELVAIGLGCPGEILRDRFLQQAPNLCCTLIYTIAPGGKHSAVMLSHDNLLWTASAVGQRLELVVDKERIVSFLPLSSTYNQIFDIYVPLLYGCTVHFVPSSQDAIKGVMEVLKEVRPTLLMAVPVLYDRMFGLLSAKYRRDKWLRQKLTNWACNVGRRMHKAHSRGHDTKPFCFCLANAIVYRHARRRLGLDETRLCLVTGAHISQQTFHFFVNLNIPILQVYGLAQTTGFHALSLPLNYRFKSVGQVLPGCNIDIINKDEYGMGEIWVKGRNVFMGYLKDPVQTLVAFDTGEWYNTGDRGTVGSDALLIISHKVQDLLIVQSGDQIAPKPIEDALKAKLPCISHCILVGEGRIQVSMLLTLKTEMDESTSEPTNRLSSSTLVWLRLLGCDGYTTVHDVRSDADHKVTPAIDKAIASVNSKVLSKSERVEKWAILPKDFSVAGGELDRSNQIDRRFVVEKYWQFIDAFYPDEEPED